MNNHLKVEGHNNLVRDRRTGAILNTNKTEIQRARTQKIAQKEKEHQLLTLTNEVDTLRDDVKLIKELLFRLVEDKD
jgi:hypothetical protein